MTINDTLHCISTIIQTTSSCGNKSQGTGFFYNRVEPKRGNRPQWRRIYDEWLVTNRHVIIMKEGGKDVKPTEVTFNLRRINESGELRWDIVTLTTDDIASHAKFHPDNEIDIAVIDISHLITNRINDDDQPVAKRAVNADMFAGKNNIDVEVSSDVLIVGYPKGFYDEVNLFPIVKAGIVASRWGVNFDGKPYFLIDAKLFPGSSGSLVLSKPVNFVVKDGKKLYSKDKQFAFLGVYAGELAKVETSVESGKLATAKKGGVDLGVVWYAQLVEDIISRGVSLCETLEQ